MDHTDRYQLLTAMFSQSLDGIFFMMLDAPVRWDDTVDREAVLEYVITHQHITTANAAFCAQYRAQMDQIVHMTPLDFFAHDVEQCRRVWRTFMDTGHLHIETEERRFDGSPMWIEGDYLWLKNEAGEYTGHFGTQRDVTERHQVERSLLDAQARFNALFEQEHDAVYLLDLDGRHITANERACAMMGYTLEEMRTLSYRQTSGDVEASRAVLQRLLAGEKIPLYQRWFVKKNGERFPAEVNVKLVRDSEGTPLYIQSLHRDVSQREALQKELERRAAHAEALNRVIEAAISSKALDPLLTVALNQLCEVFGVDGGIICTSSNQVTQNIPPGFHSLQDLLGDQAVAMLNQQIVTDWHLLRDAGGWMSDLAQRVLALGIRSSLMVPLMTDGAPVGAIGLISYQPRQWRQEEIDLAEAMGRQLGMASERLHLEQALQASEERYRTLAEMTSHYANVSKVASNGQVTLEWERSDALAQLTGYTREEIIEHGGPLALVIPEDKPLTKVSLPPSRHIEESKFRIRHQNGQIRWLHRIAFWEELDEPGILGRFYETLKDITEAKQMEARALSLHFEQERTRILRNFIRDASHEFRTPLSIIEMNLYAIRRSCQQQEHHRRFDAISSQIQIMSELVDNLLVLSLLDHDSALKFSMLHVNSLVAAECESLRSLASEKSLTLYTDLAATLPSIQADARYLSMAVRHLLHNAIRYTEEGSVRISTYGDDNHLVIEVRDSGVGMTPEIQVRIFERFYRHDDAHSQSGFGLGLSIVQKVVEHHQGHITVESVPGGGSIFRIYLPV